MSILESKSKVHGGVFWIPSFLDPDFIVKPTIKKPIPFFDTLKDNVFLKCSDYIHSQIKT